MIAHFLFVDLPQYENEKNIGPNEKFIKSLDSLKLKIVTWSSFYSSI